MRLALGVLAVLAASATPSPAGAGEPDVAASPVALAAPRGIGAGADAPAFDQAWFGGEWADYRRRFVSEDGRVVDNANGGVSHSEGQGYGLLLSAIAGDAEAFGRIWSWTRQNLYVRADGLASWKWDPVRGAVADPNNASDGDILVAWALDRAADRFGRADSREVAAAPPSSGEPPPPTSRSSACGSRT